MEDKITPKPPEALKSSKHLENLERQRQLKNRMIAVYGTNRGVPLGYKLRNNSLLYAQSSSLGDQLVRGFGEQQFADSTIHDEPSQYIQRDDLSQSSLLDASGIWTEGSQLTARYRHKLPAPDIRNHVESILKSSTEIHVPAERVAKIPTHLDVSQSLISYGHEAVANSLMHGTDFCYVEPEEFDHYRFGVKSIIPNSIKENEYSTLSVHGLMRARGTESELVSYAHLTKERILYNKLVNFKVFRTFRVWKTFKLWKEIIRRGLYNRRSRILEEVIIYANPLSRDMIFQCRRLLERLRKFPIFVTDFDCVPTFAEFLVLQQEYISKYAEEKANVLQSIVNLLCSTCEKFVYESASAAPASITTSKYKSMKVDAVATSAHMQKAAHPARKIIDFGLSASSQLIYASNVSVLDGASDVLSLKTSSSPRPRPPPSNGPRSVVSVDPSLTESQQQQQQQSHVFDMGVSYTMRAAIRVHCRKLVNLFRIIDFLFRDVLYEGLQQSVQDFYETLEVISKRNHGLVDFGLGERQPEEVIEQPVWIRSNKNAIEKQIHPLFSITAVLVRANNNNNINRSKDDQEYSRSTSNNNAEMLMAEMFTSLDFNPKREYCLTQFQQILRDACIQAMYSEGLFFQERCIKMFEPVRHELSVNNILEDRVFIDFEQNNVQELLRRCIQLFTEDLEYAGEQIEALEYIRQQSNACEVCGAAVYVSRLQGLSADDIQQQLMEWDDQYSVSNRMRSFVTMGLFKIDLADMKETSLEVLSRVQNLYLRIIPDLYVEFGDEFYRDVSKYIDHIVKEYSSLEEFVRAVEAFTVATTKIEEVSKRFRYISSLRSMLDSREIRISDAILRQNLTLGSLYQRFNNSLTDFETNFEVQVKMYKSEMMTRLKSLMIPIQDFTSYLTDLNESMANQLNNPDAVSIVDQLLHFRQEIDQVGAKLKQLDNYQTLLQIQVFERGLEAEIEKSLTANTILWRSWKVCAELTRDFMTVNFLDAHCDSVMKEINIMRNELISNHYLITIVDMMKEEHNIMQSAEVRGLYRAYNGLQKNMDDLVSVIPIVKKLQSPSLKAAHVTLIHELLRRNIFEDLDLTVGELVDVIKVLDYSAQINGIYWEAKVLFNLEQTINSTLKEAKELCFIFGNDQENRAFHYIKNCSEMKEALEHSIVTLQSCRASAHSEPLLKDIETNQEIFQQSKKFVEMYELFQSFYMTQRLLFTSPRTARQVAPFMKNFKVADEHWRLLQKAMKEDSKLVDVLRDRSVGIALNVAVESVKAIDSGFKEILHEQYERYPKLYLIDMKLLENAYVVQDMRQILLSCGSIVFSFPVQDAFFDPQEPYNTTALLVGYERIMFNKSCSGRGNVGEWLKNIEQMVHEKLEKDVKSILREDHRSIMDDLRFAKHYGQAVLLKISLKFWSSLEQIFHHELQDERGLLSRLRNLSLELSDQISMVSSLLPDAIEKRIVVLISNAIIILSSHRELVYRLIEDAADVAHSVTLGEEFDPQVELSSMLLALKKRGNEANDAVIIEQSHLKMHYGMKYIGFGHKLAITPLTERCLFTINASLNDMTTPILNGSSKTATMQLLADEVGVELYIVNAAHSFSAGNVQQQLAGIFKVCTKTSAWIVMNGDDHRHHLSTEVVSMIGNMLLTLQSAQLHQMNKPTAELLHQHYTVGKVILTGFQLLVKASFPSVFDTSKIFRPLTIMSCPLREILLPLLSSYNFVFVNKIATQLVALANHLVGYNLGSEKAVRHTLLWSIHECGVENEHNQVNASMQMSLIAKHFIPQLMKERKIRIDEYQLRLICNLYLEIVYTHEADEKDFFLPDLTLSLSSLLMNRLDNKEIRQRVVFIVGSAAVGKSTVIKAALETVEVELQKRGESRKSLENVCVIHPYAIYPQLFGLLGLPELCNKAFKHLDNSVNAEAHNYFHFDLASSSDYSDYICILANYVRKRYSYHRVTLLCEVMELSHLDPATLSFVDVVNLKERSFTLADCIELHLNECCQSGGLQFRKVLKECTNSIIRPCLHNYLEDSVTSQFCAVENIFNLISSMFYSYCFPAVNGSAMVNDSGQEMNKLHTPRSVNRFDDDSLRKIIVFACIWVIGAASALSLAKFEQWFRSYFTASETSNPRIFPTFDAQRSIFSFVLFKIDGVIWFLDWITVEHMMNKNRTTHEVGSPVYNLLYAHNTLISSNYAAFTVPTSDLLCFASIQAALSHAITLREKSSSALAIVGPNGSGKATLLKQLVSLAASPPYEHIATCKRWIYYGNDASIAETQQMILTAKSKSQHLLIEHNLADFGAIFIEDLALDPSLKSSYQEGLRALMEINTVVDQEENYQRKELLTPYCVFTATVHHNSRHHHHKDIIPLSFKRLLRHCIVYSTSPEQLTNVFKARMRPTNMVIASEVMDDLVQLSMIFFKAVHQLVLTEQRHHHWASEKLFHEPENLLLKSFCKASPSNWTAFIMTQIYASVQSIPGITSHDGIRLWDRMISDLSARYLLYPRFQELLLKAVDQTISDGVYTNNLFTDIVEKERSVRLSNLEALQSSIAAPASNDPISYTRNACGLYRTGTGIYPAVLTAEFVREVVWKKLTEDPQPGDDKLAALIRVYRTPLGLWTDVLRIVSVIAANGTQLFDMRTTLLTCRVAKSELMLRVEFAAKFFPSMKTICCAVSARSKGLPIDGELSFQVISSLLKDEYFLRQIKPYLMKVCPHCRLVDPALQSNLLDHLDSKLLQLLEKCEDLFHSIDLLDQKEIPAVQDTLWILLFYDDFAGASHSSSTAIKITKDALMLMSPHKCNQIFEFLTFINPHLDPREHEIIRSALISYSQRTHVMLSFSCASADVIFDVLDGYNDDVISVLDFYPASNNTEKFVKALDTLNDHFSNEDEKNLMINSIQTFADWFSKRRQHILQQEPQLQIPIVSSFSVIDAVISSCQSIGETLVDHPKLVELLLRAWNKINSGYSTGESMLSTKTSAPKWLSTCVMLQFAASTGCGLDRIDHGSASTGLHLVKELIASEVLSSSGIVSDNVICSAMLLTAAALADAANQQQIHSDEGTLSSGVVKLLHLHAMLPDISIAKLWLATFAFSLQFNEEVVLIDRTFTAAPLLDLLVELGLSVSAANMTDVLVDESQLVWIIKGSSSSTTGGQKKNGRRASFLIDKTDIELTVDLLIAYLLHSHAFKDGDSKLQDLWDMKHNIVTQEIDFMQTEASGGVEEHLNRRNSLAKSISDVDQANFDKQWKETSDKLLQVIDMQMLCWTRIFHSSEQKNDIAKVYIALFQHSMQMLEDMIFTPHKDMHEAELHENLGMLSMRILLIQAPNSFNMSHEEYLHVLLELVMDMFFVVHHNHTEHVVTLQNRGKIFHILRTLLKGEAVIKNGNIESVYGLIRKEKPMKHQTELVTADGSLKEINEEVEDESEADDLAEYTLLGSISRSVIKQSFQVITQFLSSEVKGTFHARYTSPHSSLTPPPQPGASIAVIAAIEAMIDDWMDWCGDPLAGMDELPEINNYTMHPLEEVILIMVLKPALLSQVLTDHIASIGFSLEPIIVREVLGSRALLTQEIAFGVHHPHCQIALSLTHKTDYFIPGIQESVIKITVTSNNNAEDSDDEDEGEEDKSPTTQQQYVVETAEDKEIKHFEKSLEHDEHHIRQRFLSSNTVTSLTALEQAVLLTNDTNNSQVKLDQLQLIVLSSYRYHSVSTELGLFPLYAIKHWMMQNESSLLLPRSLAVGLSQPMLIIDDEQSSLEHHHHVSAEEGLMLSPQKLKWQLPMSSQGLSIMQTASEYGVLWFLQYHAEFLLHYYHNNHHSQIKHRLHLAQANWSSAERATLSSMTQQVLSRAYWLMILFHTAVAIQDRLLLQSAGVEHTVHSLTLAAEIIIQRWLDIVERQREAVREMIIIEALSKKKANHRHNRDDHNKDDASATAAADDVSESVHHLQEMSSSRIEQIIDLSLRQFEESSLCSLVLYGAYNVHDASPQTNWMAAVFSAIFAPNALKPYLSYLALNAVPIPMFFTRPSVILFIQNMKQFLLESETSAGWLDLLFMSHSKLSMATGLTPWMKGLHLTLASLPLIPHNHQDGRLRKDVWYTQTSFMLHEVHHTLHKLLAILPLAIQIENNKEIAKQMTAHSLMNNITTIKGRSTMISKPRNTDNSTIGGGGGKRRLGQRLLLRFQSHEFDTLWAYLLVEVMHLNEQLNDIYQLWSHWVTLDVAGWRQYLRQLFDVHVGPGVVSDDLLTEIQTETLFKLHGGFMPPLFLYHPARWSQYFGNLVTMRAVCLPLDKWLHCLQERRQLLLTWLESGTLPPQLSLHQLQHPEGLLYAMRETFAYKADTTIDKVQLHVTCRSLHHDRHQEQKQRLEDGREMIESLGCSINLTGGMILNGLFSSRSETLELLPPYYAAHYGNEVVLHAYAALEEEARSDEQYLCPVEVATGSPPIIRALLPGCFAAQDMPFIRQQDPDENCLWAEQAKPVLKVWINTTEDVTDCAMQRIKILSGPRWFV